MAKVAVLSDGEEIPLASMMSVRCGAGSLRLSFWVLYTPVYAPILCVVVRYLFLASG